MNDLPPLYGLVLSGGHSRRMHSDKAALTYQGLPQLQRAAELLQSVCTKVFVSARNDQADALRQRWPLIIDQHDNIGPLAGIAAAQAAHPNVAWLIVACDMPWLTIQTLKQLCSARTTGYQAIAFNSAEDNQPEPLCSIWEPTAAAAVRSAITQGQHSPRRLLQALNTLQLRPHDPLTLRNINTPDDYQAAVNDMPQSTLPITAQYFAVFREQAGKRSETLTTQATTAAELYAELQQRYGFALQPTQLKVAINNEFTAWDSPLKQNDVVTFIPPVAGG